MTKGDRKLILVRADLLEKAAAITAKEGKTLFAFTNEIFEQAIEAYGMGVKLCEALEFYKMLKNGKKLRYAFVPSDVLNCVAKMLSAAERDRLLKEWHDAGEYTGNYLRIRFYGQDGAETAKSFMNTVLWNLEEVVVEADGGKVEVKCFCPSLGGECTEMLASFLQGMFASLGYVVKSCKHLKGIIVLCLEGEKEAVKAGISLAVEG